MARPRRKARSLWRAQWHGAETPDWAGSVSWLAVNPERRGRRERRCRLLLRETRPRPMDTADAPATRARPCRHGEQADRQRHRVETWLERPERRHRLRPQWRARPGLRKSPSMHEDVRR